MFPALRCPVRGCGRPLVDADGGAVCAARHRFDRARSGYLNLLQPGDSRAEEPGDSREAVAARGRSLERGLGDALLEALVVRAALAPAGALLDVGCGEGSFVGRLAARLGREAWGVDLSARAVDAAARRHPGVGFVVANADRRLPFADGAFALILSITSRQHPEELARLLAPGGVLLVAVPDEDDLAELRAALHGQATPLPAAAAARARFGAWPSLADESVRQRARLDAAALRDLLTQSYRGARQSVAEKVAGLGDMEVTVAYRLLSLRRP